jgi:hypothetical protein
VGLLASPLCLPSISWHLLRIPSNLLGCSVCLSGSPGTACGSPSGLLRVSCGSLGSVWISCVPPRDPVDLLCVSRGPPAGLLVISKGSPADLHVVSWKAPVVSWISYRSPVGLMCVPWEPMPIFTGSPAVSRGYPGSLLCVLWCVFCGSSATSCAPSVISS